jgi:hypothetical protein
MTDYPGVYADRPRHANTVKPDGFLGGQAITKSYLFIRSRINKIIPKKTKK